MRWNCILLTAAALAICPRANAGEEASTPSSADAPPTSEPAADPAEDGSVADARAAFSEGTALAREGRWIDALAAFERSAVLRPHPITLYNMAYCERALAHYTRASKYFVVAIAAHEEARWGRMSESMLAVARTYLAEAESKLARARVTLVPASAAVAINGRPLERLDSSGGALYRAGTRDLGPPEQLGGGSFEVLLDPGHQSFAVVHDGRTATTTRVMDPGTTIDLRLDVPEVEIAPPPDLRLQEVTPGEAAETPGTSPLVYVAYGVGAAGLAVAAGFGIGALVKRSDLDGLCGSPPHCPPEADDDLERARTYAQVTNVGLVVGAVGALVGTYLLLTGDSEPSPKPAATQAVTLRPWAGLGVVGGTVTF